MRSEIKYALVDYATVTKCCLNYHYSKRVPAGKLFPVGFWEEGKFLGVIVFSRGANPRIADPYKLDQTQVCELTRIAFRSHVGFLSRCLCMAIKYLREKCPEIKLIVSYADPLQGHVGTIYQASNFILEGKTQGKEFYLKDGKEVHSRTVGSHGGIDQLRVKFPASNIQRIKTPPKLKYLYPLDRKIRRQLKCYPFPKTLEDIQRVSFI